jgi:hypothetical protein
MDPIMFHPSNVTLNIALCCVLGLWMIGFHRVSHSNQNTQASIESYHDTLKHYFSFKTKGL